MRNYTLPALLTAEAVSSTGSAITFVALPWFVLSTGGSPTRMSIVLAAEILPMAVFGIPSGSVVARLGARTTMLISDLVRAPLIALVPILHWSGHLSYPELLVIVFLLGLFNAPYISSQRTILPEIFGELREDLQDRASKDEEPVEFFTLPVELALALTGYQGYGDVPGIVPGSVRVLSRRDPQPE